MTDNEKDNAIMSFLWLAWYNGFLEEVNDIYEALKKADEYTVSRPDKWREKQEWGVDEPCGVFWSWLVMMYGDYGTSPRFGWIESKNAEYLISVFEEFRKDCDFTNIDELYEE